MKQNESETKRTRYISPRSPQIAFRLFRPLYPRYDSARTISRPFVTLKKARSLGRSLVIITNLLQRFFSLIWLPPRAERVDCGDEDLALERLTELN